MIKDFNQELLEYCSGIRRYLHQNPELSFCENSSAEFIIQELQKLGIEGHRIAKTGVYAILDSGNPGPVVAIRADIDALPLQEKSLVSYISKVPGVMHACGHDGHTAILLGLAKSIIENPLQIKGKLMLLFQPAEETPPGGALEIIKSGILNEVDYILGSHLTNQLLLGQIGIRSGNIMASIDRFSVGITGKGGHGSTPHRCVDPIIAGAYLVTAWQTIISRNTDPMEPTVLTTGTFTAGSNFNIIPEEAVITGSVRSLSETVRAAIENRFYTITQEVCDAFGVSCEISYEQGYPVLSCCEGLTDKIKGWFKETFGENMITEPPMIMWSEDFAYYGKKAPIVYFFIGARNEERGYIYENHNPQFDFDEEAMLIGINAYRIILKNID